MSNPAGLTNGLIYRPDGHDLCQHVANRVLVDELVDLYPTMSVGEAFRLLLESAARFRENFPGVIQSGAYEPKAA